MKYFHRILFTLSLLGVAYTNAYAQSGQISVDYAIQPDSLSMPILVGNQRVVGLVSVHNHQGRALTKDPKGFYFLDVNKTDPHQIFWLIHDYDYDAFAFVGAEKNNSNWMGVNNWSNKLACFSNTRFRTTADPQKLAANYFFEFQSKNPVNFADGYLIRSVHRNNRYFYSPPNQHHRINVMDAGNAPDTARFLMKLNFIKRFTGDFLSLPMSAPAGMQSNDNDTTTTLTVSQRINDNHAVSVSGRGLVFNNEGSKRLFSIRIDTSTTEATVGLIDYRWASYGPNFYTTPGAKRPVSGIEVEGDDIYLFTKQQRIKTNFVKDSGTIVFGYVSGELHAEQAGVQHMIPSVPTSTLLNGSDGNIRLMSILPEGKIELGYRYNSIFFSNDFTGPDSMDNYSTDPDLSYSPTKDDPANTFDWRTETYALRYKESGVVVEEAVISPFYDSDPAFRGISAEYGVHTNGKVYTRGGEDFNGYEGWELIRHDFGYSLDETLKPSHQLRAEPYMILYDRFSGKLRVFVYVKNPSIANKLQISLINGPTQGHTDRYADARMWGGFLQGKALDDPSLGKGAYSKAIKLKSTNTGGFVYADFTMTYDPCVCEFESNFRVQVDKITEGDMKIVGRTLGGSIPANSPVIGDWLSKSDNYLTGTLNNTYGQQSKTLGDITFRNYDQWGTQEWKSEASFVLPGRKAEAWEIEAARLEYEGSSTMSAGDMLSAVGKGVKGVSKLAGGNKVGEGIGELIDAAGTALKGTGRSIKSHALKIRYDAIRNGKLDVPDKKIDIALPKPQPSIVFSELAASGSLSIETTLFDDVIITTPGSKNSSLAPNDANYNGLRGVFPMYNEPLGVFNMMYQPKVALSVVKQEDGVGDAYLGVNVRLKNKLYLASRLPSINGILGGYFTITPVITTYNRSGEPMTPVHGQMYLFTPNDDRDDLATLPNKLDVSDLIDQATILENIKHSQDVVNQLSKWITVEFEVDYWGLAGKMANGQYIGTSIRQSFISSMDSNSVTYMSVPAPQGVSVEQLASDLGQSHFASYNGSNHPEWGNQYIIHKSVNGYESKMSRYCTSTVTDVDTASITPSKSTPPSQPKYSANILPEVPMRRIVQENKNQKTDEEQKEEEQSIPPATEEKKEEQNEEEQSTPPAIEEEKEQNEEEQSIPPATEEKKEEQNEEEQSIPPATEEKKEEQNEEEQSTPPAIEEEKEEQKEEEQSMPPAIEEKKEEQKEEEKPSDTPTQNKLNEEAQEQTEEQEEEFEKINERSLIKIERSVVVYPNPSDGHFNVHYTAEEEGDIVLAVYDLGGNEMIRHTHTAYEIGEAMQAVVNVYGVERGIYLLVIEYRSGKRYTKKLIKR